MEDASPAYFPHTGTPKVLVILAEFQDEDGKFRDGNCKEVFESYLNDNGVPTAVGDSTKQSVQVNALSVKGYFKHCSYGAFEPQFDVYGPVTLSQNLAYYGAQIGSKNDAHVTDSLIPEACNLIDKEVDFTQYDADNNPVMVTDKDGNLVQAQKVVTDPGKAFNSFGTTHTYSGSMSLSTRIYGMFNFGKHRKVQAIRHVITPSMSISYSPEKGTAFNGWRTLDGYYDKRGSYHAESYYNIYSVTGHHNSVSPPGRGKTGSMSFSVGNNLEAKVRDLKDTTGTGTKKVKLIDQLSFNGSYNFLADSLKMSNIGVSASTNLFNKLNISGNLNFDPYAVNERGQKINKFNIVATGVPLRLTNASLSMSIAFNGKGSINGNDGSKSGAGGGDSSGSGTSDANSYRRIYYHPLTGEYIPGGFVYYMNPNAPWSVNFSYSFSYSKSYQYTNNQLLENKRITQTINASANIKLTPRMSIQATTGFDVMAMKMTTTQINATYDLHCFNIAVTWVPMGQWQSYSFRIAANASALADLLRFKKSSSPMDNLLR